MKKTSKPPKPAVRSSKLVSDGDERRTELKPCPLCGGKPHDKGYGISCEGCGLWLGDGTRAWEFGGYKLLWNLRAPSRPPMEVSERDTAADKARLNTKWRVRGAAAFETAKSHSNGPQKPAPTKAGEPHKRALRRGPKREKLANLQENDKTVATCATGDTKNTSL